MRDWAPRLMAAVGEPDIKEKLRAGNDATGKTFKVHQTATSNNYRTWWVRRVFVVIPSQVITQKFLDKFKEFLPSSKTSQVQCR